jgi:epoxyqueuosine reductase
VDPAEAKTRIAAEARALGFEAVGVEAFLALGRQGDMDWLARRAEARGDPRRLWPEVRSVVVVGANYGLPGDPLAALARRDRGTISVYARGEDYHDVLKRRLKRLGRFVAETYGAEVKVFVDTAPVMEKPLAGRAGLGWQGKHTNVVSRELGSWLFLGELFTTLDLPPDEAEADHCGTCRACQDVCPTRAFPEPYRLDARRCISYLTIEHKGHIAEEFRRPMGNRIYGCDDCLAVCPWNKYARLTAEPAFLPRAELTAPRLAELAELDDQGFRRLFAGSAIKRLGRDRFVRNVLIALGNSGDRRLSPVVERRLDDASPLVRAMAVWALARLAAPDRLRSFARERAAEPDPAVRHEWASALDRVSSLPAPWR